jgi:hypothetical protein
MIKPCKSRLILPFLFMAVVVASPAFAQSNTEAKFVLQDIQTWLPVTYDNVSQLLLETAFGSGAEGNHPWLHLEIEAAADTGLGDAVFLVTSQDRAAAEQAPTLKLLAFSVDKPMRAVRMEAYDLPAGMVANGDSGAAMAAAAVITDESCPVYWRQGPGHVYGAMQGGWCEAESSDPAVLLRVDMSLTQDEFWMYRASKNAGSGDLLDGRQDEVPLRFKKAMMYECFVSIRHREGNKVTTINPFFINDGGGQFFFETDEPSPRKMEVFLRRSMWTSRSGENFIPMLLLLTHEEGGDRNVPLTTSWARAENGLVGWFTPSVGNGGCKLQPPSLDLIP